MVVKKTTKKTTAKKTEAPKKMTLVEKMFNIMCELDFIEKDAKNNHSNYNYASEKAIKIAVHDAFVRNRVICIPQFRQQSMIEVQDGKKIATLNAEFQFINVDDPTDTLTASCIGSGNGRDDKGLYAAITGAIKYAYTACFLIPTGDDAEADGDRPVQRGQAPQNEAQEPEKVPASQKPAPAVKPVVAKPAASKPVPAKKTVAKKPVPAKKAEVKKPVVAKKPVAAKPAPAAEPTAKEPVPVHTWGDPEGDPCMSENDYKKAKSAFAAFDISEAELEKVSGMPLMNWTENIKDCALNNYNMLVSGSYTKKDALAL